MTGYRGQGQIPHQPLNEIYVHCRPCEKRAFTTRRGAKISLKTLVRFQGDKASALHVYRCPDNEANFHVGHVSRRR